MGGQAKAEELFTQAHVNLCQRQRELDDAEAAYYAVPAGGDRIGHYPQHNAKKAWDAARERWCEAKMAMDNARKLFWSCKPELSYQSGNPDTNCW